MGWVIGNEWNYNGIYAGLKEAEAIQKLREATDIIKRHDNLHPVRTVFGEIPNAHILNELDNIDVWGITSYRGLSFGSLFSEWESVSSKPMFLAEYGADAYDAVQQRENQEAQALATTTLTHEILEQSSTRGGLPRSKEKTASIYFHTGERIVSVLDPGSLGIPVLKNLHHSHPHYHPTTGQLFLLLHGDSSSGSEGRFAVLRHVPW